MRVHTPWSNLDALEGDRALALSRGLRDTGRNLQASAVHGWIDAVLHLHVYIFIVLDLDNELLACITLIVPRSGICDRGGAVLVRELGCWHVDGGTCCGTIGARRSGCCPFLFIFCASSIESALTNLRHRCIHQYIRLGVSTHHFRIRVDGVHVVSVYLL